MWVSCGWRAEDEAEPGEEAERVVEVEVAEGGVRIYVAIEPVEVAAASMGGLLGEKWMSRTPNGTGRVWMMWLRDGE